MSMKLYYNTKTERFEEQKTATRSAAKILLTAEILEANKKGTYGPKELDGQYYSEINGVEFLWDDIRLILVNPNYDIRIYNPANFYDTVCIDR